MGDFLTVKCLDEAEAKRLEEEIRRAIAEKKALGLLTDRDVEDIIHMKLKPLPDIQDVQVVYDNHLYRKP